MIVMPFDQARRSKRLTERAGVFAIWGVLILQPVKAEERPLYQCATAENRETEHKWLFRNQCEIAVYWTIDCLSGPICLKTEGGGRLVLQPRESATRVFNGIQIGGPYRN
jgi:hypothetical protein